MEQSRRAFLTDLLETPSPSGFEARGQRVWTEYVRSFADDVRTDAYGNAIAIHEGREGTPTIAIGGHADEVGFMVRDILEDGFLRITPIGGADKTVSKGQHVTVHAEEPVQGVIGQTAIHLRGDDPDEDQYEDLHEQFVDIGAETEDEAGDLVEVGDPVTFTTTIQELAGTRLAARGLDNRVGTWAAAEAFRRAGEASVEASVVAVSTVQEEVGLQGAKMVGFDLEPDAYVAIDVTHATDNPDVGVKRRGPVELGAGPVISRGSANHPALVDLARTVADEAGIDIQLQATGIRTGTDADAIYTEGGGIPSVTVSFPNRYMHTPVEVVDTEDLVAVAELVGAMTEYAVDAAPFAVDI